MSATATATILHVAKVERDSLAGNKRRRSGSPVRPLAAPTRFDATPADIGALFQNIHAASSAASGTPGADPLYAAEHLENAYNVVSGMWKKNPAEERTLLNIDLSISDALQAIQKIQCADGDDATNRRDFFRCMSDIRDAYTELLAAARKWW
jgi:hypothetical protein